MQNQSSSLNVIINPPDILRGMPGDSLKLYPLITNQGKQDALIYVYFDDRFQHLIRSNTPLEQSLGLASQQSFEVSFEFQIPINTKPGTYEFSLIVNAPNDYPEEPDIVLNLQIQVLIKEQTVIHGRENPTFTIEPTTNPNKPLVYRPGQPLQVTVKVNNCCKEVDRFRLTCLELDNTWLTIRYARTGFEGAGVLSEQSGLELNDYSQGDIWLEFHPPADTFAGPYSPTIQLHSQDKRDLILLDLVYITIPEVYDLDVKLKTNLGKVSQAGKYELKISNRGNTTRELFISAKTQDEEELCDYKFEPSKVTLLPTKSVDVSLTVKPLNFWRQPWFGSGLLINFNIEIQDQKQLPLPETLPPGTLVWKARPWWQFLLLLLFILGILGGSAFIIWQIFRPVPILIDEFKPTSYSYDFGNRVVLNFQISNINYAEKVKLSLMPEGANPQEDIIYESGKKSPCLIKDNILNCNNYETGAKLPGKYILKLVAYNRKGTSFEKQFQVDIKQPPTPEIVYFKPDKPTYEKGQTISFSWEISNYEQLANLEIIKQENAAEASLKKLDFSQGIPAQLQKQCLNPKNNQLMCSNVVVKETTPGIYIFKLKPTAKPPRQEEVLKPSETTVNVLPKLLKIKTFTLNGSSQSPQTLEEGQEVILNWEVEGDQEDMNVMLSTDGSNLPRVGSKKLSITPSLNKVDIEVTYKNTKYSQKDQKIILINVKPKANLSPLDPVPDIVQPPVVPAEPSANSKPPEGF